MRTSTRRLTALMLGLWFALYLGAPQLVHPCPEHAAASAGGAAAGHAHPGAQHAHDGAVPGGSARDGEKSAPSHSGAGCCCPGPQCGAGAMTLTSPATLFRSPVSLVGAMVRSWHEETPARRPDFFIPFGTAPPPASHA